MKENARRMLLACTRSAQSSPRALYTAWSAPINGLHGKLGIRPQSQGVNELRGNQPDRPLIEPGLAHPVLLKRAPGTPD